MALTSKLKRRLNDFLRPINLRLDTWTVADADCARLEALRARKGFDAPVYALTGGMARFDGVLVAESYSQYRGGLERLLDPALTKSGFDNQNSYFKSPDADVLYLLVRALRPNRIVEVGSGNSTRIMRQAVVDGELQTEIVAIDPCPRREITDCVDRFENVRLEHLTDLSVFERLGAGDILFIDSSHEAFVGNDVAYLFCRIIPILKPGVIIHVHDIFLPYEYPLVLAKDYPNWGEQYVLHAMIFSKNCEVLWPGYHVQRDRPELHDSFPFVKSGTAQSFWFRWA